MKYVSAILLLLFSSCSSYKQFSELPKSEQEFYERYSDVIQIYKAVPDVELAKAVMLKLEKQIMDIEGNPKVFRDKRKNDFLYPVRLRIWGIYDHIGNTDRKNEYRDLLQGMSKADEGFDDQTLKQAFLEEDGAYFPPKWSGRVNEAAEEMKNLTLEEMIEKGYVEVTVHPEQ